MTWDFGSADLERRGLDIRLRRLLWVPGRLVLSLTEGRIPGGERMRRAWVTYVKCETPQPIQMGLNLLRLL